MLTSINQIAGYYAVRSKASAMHDLTVSVHKGSVLKKTGVRSFKENGGEEIRSHIPSIGCAYEDGGIPVWGQG